MNRLRFIIPTLIQINVVVAILSVVFVIIIREQQAQMTTHAQDALDSPSIGSPLNKNKIANYQQRLQQNEQKINRYEQQLKGLKTELEAYKAQNALLMQINRSNSETVASENPPSTRQSSVKSSVYSKKPRSIKWVVKPETREPQPLLELIEPIEIADNAASTSVSLSGAQPLEQANLPVTQEIQITEKKIEFNRENEDRLDDQRNNLVVIAPNPEPEEYSTNPSEPETTPEVAPLTILFPHLDNKRDISTHYANNIAYGLAIAADEGQINHGTRMYRKVQTAIRLLRRGESTEEATRRAKVPTSVMSQLMKWGEKRPGSLLNKSNEK